MTAIRRNDDLNICSMETDAVTLWTCGIVEFKIDTRNGEFIMMPIMRDKSKDPVIDATDAFEKFQQEQRR